MIHTKPEYQFMKVLIGPASSDVHPRMSESYQKTVEISMDEYREYQTLKTDKDRQDRELMERFRLKSRCDLCGYQSLDIYPNQNLGCPSYDCNGYMEEIS